MINFGTFKRLLYDKRINKYDLLRELKETADLDNIKKILKANRSHPLVKNILSINALPKSYEDISKRKQIGFTHDLKPEIYWQLLHFEEYSNEINTFLVLKADYDRKMLIGSYDDAYKILEQIENDICYSHWSLENKFLIKEYQSGVKENWNILSEINKMKLQPMTAILADSFSKRAEKKISYFRFKNLLENQLEELVDYKYFYEYLCFRIHMFGYRGYENFSHIQYLESQASIIDRYLAFINIASEIISQKRNEYFKIVKDSTNYIELFIDDESLIQISNHIGDSKPLLNSSISHEVFVSYTKGDYEKVINYCKEYIPNHPDLYELWEIYVKALIESKQEFIVIENAGFLNSILENLYGFFKKDEDFRNSSQQLLKLMLSFTSTRWAKQIYNVIFSHYNWSEPDYYNTLSSINSTINNPYFVIKSEQSNFPETLKNSNIVIPIIEYYLGKNDVEPKELEYVINGSKELYKARNAFNRKVYTNCINLLSPLLESNDISNYRKEEVIVMLYYSYLETKQNRKALELLIDNFLENSNLVEKLDRNELVKLVESDNYEETRDLISMPILFNIAEKDNYTQYVSYDVFLSHYNYEKPSELFKNTDIFKKDSLIYFLNNICIQSVLHHSIYFDGTDDIEKERIKICQYLSKIDIDNANEYNSEISQITQKSAIRKGLQHISKGRINVNIENIKRIEENNIRESFDRYQELTDFAQNSDLRSIDNTSKLLMELIHTMYGNDTANNSILSASDPAFVSFKVMFLDIRDKFLFSKEYGLDGCLSTRIRHGTLLNQIRSVFEKENLITSKNSEGKYLQSEYWNNFSFCSNPVTKESFHNSLSLFSKEIDDFNEYIRSELIQIKSEKNQKKPYALFDFSYTDSELLILFGQLKAETQDYQRFLNFSFSTLQEKTENCLYVVRSYLNNQIATKYNELITKFSESVRSLGIERSCPELSSSLVRIGTNIYQELSDISKWFVLSDTSSSNYLGLESIIKTAVESINNIYPNKQINPRIECNSNIPLIGDLCTNLIFINQILIDNAITHSSLPNNELELIIEANLVDKRYIKIMYKNNLKKGLDIKENINSLEGIKTNWNNTAHNIARTNMEGGSGLNKIKRILSYDLFRKEDTFDYKTDEDYMYVYLSFEIEIFK